MNRNQLTMREQIEEDALRRNRDASQYLWVIALAAVLFALVVV
jgi:hypothetical protein